MSSGFYVTRKEAAGFLGVARTTLSNWIYRGRLHEEDTAVGRLLRLDEVAELKREREEWYSLLDARRVGEMLGIGPQAIRDAAREGKLRAQRRGKNVRFRLEDVIAYWQGHLRGACARCSILGEASVERGFMCPACEYEKRTGRIYPWPRQTNGGASGWAGGRLALQPQGG